MNHYLHPNANGRSRIISIGGTSEMEFDYIRHLLRKAFDVDEFNNYVEKNGETNDLKITATQRGLKTRATMLTGTGSRPPYYPAFEEGDIPLPDLAGMKRSAIRELIAAKVYEVLDIRSKAIARIQVEKKEARKKARASRDGTGASKAPQKSQAQHEAECRLGNVASVLRGMDLIAAHVPSMDEFCDFIAGMMQPAG